MNDSKDGFTSFLGTGWSFPPEFIIETGEVAMVSDEDDIRESLIILLNTAFGERFLQPKYGLDMHELLFEAISTSLQTFLKDRIRTAILIYEPRINLLDLELDTTAQYDGYLQVSLDYEIRATNSRYNLVYPFYIDDGNEMRVSVGN